MENTRATLEQQLIEKAWTDEKFHTELINNPKPLIEQVLGQALPQSIKINVVEETVDTLYLIIPVNPDNLPDEMLDLVAGGEHSLEGRCWHAEGGGF